MTIYEKCQKALFEYLNKTTYRDRWYFILVFEHEPFNTETLYKVELEPSREMDYSDLILIFDMDYDEGQEIDIECVFSGLDVKNILCEKYHGGLLHE